MLLLCPRDVLVEIIQFIPLESIYVLNRSNKFLNNFIQTNLTHFKFNQSATMLIKLKIFLPTQCHSVLEGIINHTDNIEIVENFIQTTIRSKNQSSYAIYKKELSYQAMRHMGLLQEYLFSIPYEKYFWNQWFMEHAMNYNAKEFEEKLSKQEVQKRLNFFHFEKVVDWTPVLPLLEVLKLDVMKENQIKFYIFTCNNETNHLTENFSQFPIIG